MEDSQIIHHIYRAVKQALVEKLGRQGYVVVEEKENDHLYNSRVIIWSDNSDLIRFTWDGKENIFLVEVSEDLPIRPLTAWSSLSITPFEPYRHPDPGQYIFTTAEKIVNSLN